jgi:hypothetical protein
VLDVHPCCRAGEKERENHRRNMTALRRSAMM